MAIKGHWKFNLIVICESIFCLFISHTGREITFLTWLDNVQTKTIIMYFLAGHQQILTGHFKYAINGFICYLNAKKELIFAN